MYDILYEYAFGRTVAFWDEQTCFDSHFVQCGVKRREASMGSYLVLVGELV